MAFLCYGNYGNVMIFAYANHRFIASVAQLCLGPTAHCVYFSMLRYAYDWLTVSPPSVFIQNYHPPCVVFIRNTSSYLWGLGNGPYKENGLSNRGRPINQVHVLYYIHICTACKMGDKNVCPIRKEWPRNKML